MVSYLTARDEEVGGDFSGNGDQDQATAMKLAEREGFEPSV
jgi:hypothetical protein